MKMALICNVFFVGHVKLKIFDKIKFSEIIEISSKLMSSFLIM